MQPISMDKERVHFNLAKLKKGGEHFEVVIDPDQAILYKNKKISDVKDVLKSTHIFSDAKKGLLASKEHMATIFEGKSPIEVAKMIIDDGEIQLSQAYRDEQYANKKKQIVETIHRNGVDPKNDLPHPMVRIENAMEEVNVKIDYYKSADDQVQEVLKQIRTVLPIKFETLQVEVKIGAKYANKMYGPLSSFGNIHNDHWLDDGVWVVLIEIPAGIQNEFYDRLNALTHGDVSTRIVKKI